MSDQKSNGIPWELSEEALIRTVFVIGSDAPVSVSFARFEAWLAQERREAAEKERERLGSATTWTERNMGLSDGHSESYRAGWRMGVAVMSNGDEIVDPELIWARGYAAGVNDEQAGVAGWSGDMTHPDSTPNPYT